MTHLNSILLAVLLTFSASSYAQFGDSAGFIHSMKGRATVTSPDGDIRRIRRGGELYSTEMVSTASGSYARLRLKDKSWIMLRPNSRFLLEEVEFEEETEEGTGFFSLLKGGFRAVTGLIANKLKYRYNTAVATIGIRGTHFMVRLCNGECYDIDPQPPNGLYLEVIEDTVVLDNNAGQFTFQAGQFAYIPGPQAAAQLLDDRPDVFVQSPIPVADPADCDQ
jgi:hypothetical protein